MPCSTISAPGWGALVRTCSLYDGGSGGGMGGHAMGAVCCSGEQWQSNLPTNCTMAEIHARCSRLGPTPRWYAGRNKTKKNTGLGIPPCVPADAPAPAPSPAPATATAPCITAVQMSAAGSALTNPIAVGDAWP